MCNTGKRDRIYEGRNQVRELNRLIVSLRLDPECGEVALLT